MQLIESMIAFREKEKKEARIALTTSLTAVLCALLSLVIQLLHISGK
jgi:hypothetical protein